LRFGGQKPILFPDKRTKEKNMDAQSIASATAGNYFSRYKGKIEIVTFEGSFGFASEMRREAAKHYLERNVKLEAMGSLWKLTMENEFVRA
jgi:hypothetical protein